ncbi:hypothetical protein FPOAC1_010361 [Fusarium poae]|uniref:hypothetical protein n=1 Tax=Fusarium poae TaxID=36050 RepID=UPI001CEB1F76|nr:hypothetical protein FPOAC1_010361 [Fusarium poae]KAG8665562.1 hypothetical protein FPOAC1_010361 [Fusarium poae]
MSDEDREVTEPLSGAEKLWNHDGRKSGSIRDRLSANVGFIVVWGLRRATADG